jgi:tetratricopeptide (TPR) repeat protein
MTESTGFQFPQNWRETKAADVAQIAATFSHCRRVVRQADMGHGDETDRARRTAVPAAAAVATPDVMRSKAESYAALGLSSSARFLADKAATPYSSPDDSLRLARIHAAAGHHRRALRVLGVDGTGDATRGPASANTSASRLTESSFPARLLASQCLYAIAEFDECLAVLGDVHADPARTFGEMSPTAAGADLPVATAAHPPSYRRRVALGGSGPTGKSAALAASVQGPPRHNSQNQLPFTSAASDAPELRAALCVMRARVFEELENMENAAWWYKRALVWDLYCYEAFVRLTEAGLVTSEEATHFARQLHAGCGDDPLWRSLASISDSDTAAALASTIPSSSSVEPALVTSLRSPQKRAPFGASASAGPGGQASYACHSDARNWMCSFYRVRVDRSCEAPRAQSARDTSCITLSLSEAAPAVQVAPRAGRVLMGAAVYQNSRSASDLLVSEPGMDSNLDVMTLRAVRLYDIMDFDECVRLTRTIMSRDPGIEHRVVLVHLAALVEIDLRHELFVMAHALVDQNPRDAVSWMAVGYYYFACGKHELARRYLQKATSINPRLGPAWLAFGHAFGAQDESDQAMASYRTASRLLPGAQLPPLCMGMEYARQSSPAHATSFFHIASEACPSDPAARHELGVMALRSGDLQGAVTYFKAALSLWETSDGLKEVLSSNGRRANAEEATLFNLGHCYRRLRDHANAKQCYERALGLKPRTASTCGALGLTLHAMGKFSAAVAMYHRALRYSPEDALTVAMLERALEDMCKYPTA